LGRVWTKDKISLKLNELYLYEKVNASYVRKHYSSLYAACVNHFISYKKAVEYASIDYEEVKLKSSVKYKLIEEANILKESNNLKYSVLHGDKKNLLPKINRYFNSINEFLEIMEVKYEEYNDIGLVKWDKNLILKELKEIYLTSTLTPFELLKLHSSLHTACRKHFGSLEIALKEININYEEIKVQKIWSIEKIEKELLYLKETEKVTSSYMLKNHLDLHHACRNHFGSYKNALKHVGIELEFESDKAFKDSVELSRKWSKEKVKKELLILYKEGHLMDSFVRKFHKDLHHACLNYFGSYREAIAYIGVDYEEIAGDSFNIIGIGFEMLLCKIFDKINVVYERKTVNGLRPDFRLDNNVWVDAKLSQWTSSIDNTINKYKDHCEELIIVYLRGYSDESVREDGIKVVSVYKYLKDLGVSEDNEVFNWLDDLLLKVKE
jgi:hypothetical protein